MKIRYFIVLLLGVLIGSALFWLPILMASEPSLDSVTASSNSYDYLGSLSFYTSLLVALVTLFVAANILWVVDQHRYFERVRAEYESKFAAELKKYDEKISRDTSSAHRKIASVIQSYQAQVKLQLFIELGSDACTSNSTEIYSLVRRLEQRRAFESLPIISKLRAVDVSVEINEVCDDILARRGEQLR